MAKEQLRENVADALIPLCTDSSDKARASGLRAVGCMAELGLKPQQVQELADLQLRFCRMVFLCFYDHLCIFDLLFVSFFRQILMTSKRCQSLWHPIPGSIQFASHALLTLRLTEAVQKPPPKCQWNGCRSAGQLAAATGHLVVKKLMEALCDLFVKMILNFEEVLKTSEKSSKVSHQEMWQNRIEGPYAKCVQQLCAKKEPETSGELEFEDEGILVLSTYCCT